MMWTSYDERFVRSFVQHSSLSGEVSEHARSWPVSLEGASPACTVNWSRAEETERGAPSPATGPDGPPPVTLTQSHVMGG